MAEHLMIGTPHSRNLAPEYVQSLLCLIMHSPIQGRITVAMEQGIYIHRNRNELFVRAQKSDCDALIMVDSDIEFSPQNVRDILDSPYDVATGIYVSRWNGKPVVFKWANEAEDGIDCAGIQDQPYQVDACGAGFLMIRRKILDLYNVETMKSLGFPFDYNNKKHGEDIAFCSRLGELGIPIYALPHVRLGHVGYYKFFEALGEEGSNMVPVEMVSSAA